MDGMKNMRMTFSRAVVLGVLMVVAGAVLHGCGKNAESRSYAVLEGRVIQIDSGGVIHMAAYRPKTNSEFNIAGMLAPNAEIIINGATARQEDICVGDRVKVTGYKDKQNEQIVATKVEIKRDVVLEGAPLTTTAPASTTQSN